MLTSGAHVLGLQDLIIPDLRSLLNFLATDNNEALFLLPHVPVGDRMLYKHYRKYYSVLQDGMDVALSFLEVYGVLLGTPGVSLDLFFQTKEQRIQTRISQEALCHQQHPMSPGGTWKRRVSPGYSGVSSAI